MTTKRDSRGQRDKQKPKQPKLTKKTVKDLAIDPNEAAGLRGGVRKAGEQQKE
jgi:hypothetical protein